MKGRVKAARDGDAFMSSRSGRVQTGQTGASFSGCGSTSTRTPSIIRMPSTICLSWSPMECPGTICKLNLYSVDTSGFRQRDFLGLQLTVFRFIPVHGYPSNVSELYALTGYDYPDCKVNDFEPGDPWC